MTENIKVGDIVKLKSGGPDMTVERVFDSHKSVECVWFSKLETTPFQFSGLNKDKFLMTSLKQTLVQK